MRNYRVREGCHSCVNCVLHDGAYRCTQVTPAASVVPYAICEDWKSRAVTLAQQQAAQNPDLPGSAVFRSSSLKGGVELPQPTVLIGGKPA
jgi:hypothetical protein